MSEEEKETIRFLKIFSRTEIDYCKLEKADVLDILNVITRKDEEIEELKKEIEELRKPKYLYNSNTGEITKLENSEYISKDKIKEKIKEYSNDKYEFLVARENIITILNELLEEK